MVTSRDSGHRTSTIEVVDWLEIAASFDELLGRHEEAGPTCGRASTVTGGQRRDRNSAFRLHIFHLLQTVSPNSLDLDVGVPARGLHGEAYRGHVFWDDLFVFPVLNRRLPELSRSLTAYRYRRLPAARRGARSRPRGAMYPWQSGSDGREQSALLHLNPKSGRWLPDTTYLQRHVGIAVARSAWQYYQATGDREFSRGGRRDDPRDRPVLREQRRLRRDRDRYVIRGIVGPDEFQPATQGARRGNRQQRLHQRDDDLAAAARHRGAGPAARASPGRAHPEAESEGDRARTVGAHLRRMFVPFHAGGIISQFEGYDDLKELTGRTTAPGTATSAASTGYSRPRTIRRTGTRSPSRPTC